MKKKNHFFPPSPSVANIIILADKTTVHFKKNIQNLKKIALG